MGTDYGAAADAQGNYRITGVPVNTYQVRASIIGYKPMIKTDVVVNSSKPFQVDFELMEETIQLEDVTVKSRLFLYDPTELISTRSFGYEEITPCSRRI
jgi:hypothetical protein